MGTRDRRIGVVADHSFRRGPLKPRRVLRNQVQTLVKHHTRVNLTDEELRRGRFKYGRVDSDSLQQDLDACQAQVMGKS